MTWCSLIAGSFVAIVFGLAFVKIFLWFIQTFTKIRDDRARSRPDRFPAWVIGIIERSFFMLIVAFSISGAATAMIGWLALKLASNWNRPGWKSNDKENQSNLIANAFTTIMAGMVSMTFSLIGGLLISNPNFVGKFTPASLKECCSVVIVELQPTSGAK